MYATINGKLMYKDEFIADIVVSDRPYYHVSNLQCSRNLPWSLVRHPNGFGLELFIEDRITPRERPSLRSLWLKWESRNTAFPGYSLPLMDAARMIATG